MMQEKATSNEARQKRLPPLIALTGFRATGRDGSWPSSAAMISRHSWLCFREQERLLLAERMRQRGNLACAVYDFFRQKKLWKKSLIFNIKNKLALAADKFYSAFILSELPIYFSIASATRGKTCSQGQERSSPRTDQFR